MSGAGVSLLLAAASWLSLLIWTVGRNARTDFPYYFVPGFLLLGATSGIVAVFACFIERTTLAYLALLVGSTPAFVFLYWLSHFDGSLG